ncbi:response regulator [Shinella sp. CPCC 101442]|uniref:response regulator n=1 Tax=Shinella sp. CPCC 101442 TaxID=2932265 RepID=UPI002152954C|nr:response regulator [Shinella sp. CPCC 101442]MCR6502112.1 response regulator [Shinella sp. CPCC 101442]
MAARSILVVEDDGLIRMDLVDTLLDGGFEVIDAANADQALALLEKHPMVGAILTDIDMPGSMNGLGLAKIASERWPDCRIIVISGRYNPNQGAMPEGSLFLSKPISVEGLAAALQEMRITPR